MIEENKPFKDKFYDAILYGDSWEKLSRFEKTLRIISFCLIVTIPFMWLGELYNESVIEDAKMVNKKTWEYRKDEEKQDFYKILKKSKIKTIKEAKEKALEKFYFKKKDDEYEPTTLGKKVNKKDNIFCIADWDELNKKQKLIRSTTIFLSVCTTLMCSYSLLQSHDKFSKILFTSLSLLLIAFILTVTICYSINEETRSVAKELGISTTATKVVIEEVSKSLVRK